MKLAVSNIAWPADLDREVYALLVHNGVEGVEIAPTRLWPHWEGITPAAIRHCRAEIEDAGLRVSSLQSILYQKPDLLLFDGAEKRAALHRHLCDCADIAVSLGAECLVFGAPKNRNRGACSESDAFSIASEFFSRLAPEFVRRGVSLVFEANPPQYGCDFATTSEVAERLVRAVGSSGFRLHLDTACMHLAGEEITQSVHRGCDVLGHFHVSEAHLGAFCEPAVPHLPIARQLMASGYRGWAALEMRAAATPLAALECALRLFTGVYRELH